MKKLLTLGVALMTLALGAAAFASAATEGARRDVIYSCSCGSIYAKRGDCACGKPTKWRHVVRAEGDTLSLCTCDEGCKCSISKDDPTKCGCGKAVEKVSVKGKDIYYCNCGGSCGCNTVSDKPGECGCGMKLKKAE